MRFESIEARAFGPFRGASLELSPGMNVVYGANEAGKSTWHAALYAGLCGTRRGKGRAARRDVLFERRHRPWDDNGAWEVGAVVELADGRRVALRHDLAGKVESSAQDADIAGRDYSNEIVFDGAPDGSRWLGLNRVSFLHTACVRQAQMLALRNGAEALQGALQAAADSAGTDATAARALELLSDYRRERVGSERARTKPLMQWRGEVDAARGALTQAREARREYLGERARIGALEATLRDTRARLDAARARDMAEQAERSRARLAKARALAERFVAGPPRPFDDHVLADRVAGAIATWAARPTPRDPGGVPAADLERRRAELELELDSVASRPRRGPRVLFAGAMVAVVAGVAVGIADFMIPGGALVAVGLGLLWWSRRTLQSEQAQETATLEAERDRLTEELARRRQADAVVAEATRGLAAAELELRRTSAAAGVAGDTPAACHDGLLAWQQRRRQRLEASEREQEAWDTLQRLLAGQTIEELSARTEDLTASADAAREALDATLLAGGDTGGDTGSDSVDELEVRERQARDALQSARGALRERASHLPDLAAAEERLAQAEARLDAIERLDATLGNTIEFLAGAERRVHRDIAHILRETVLEWLPRVTDGRYSECRVDPASLSVEVRGPDGRFVSAELLSHGTAEQVYLLLRLALARHLTVRGEVCPLLLDDALSGCDAKRARALLESLLAIAAATQVILFTHDDEVLAWARERLQETRHRVVELAPPGPA